MLKFFARLKEPSSLAGLSMLAVLFGVKPEVAQMIADATVAVVTAGTVPNPATVIGAVVAVGTAVAAVVVPEQKPPLLIVREAIK